MVRLRVEEDGTPVVERIAKERGHQGRQQQAAFLGISETTWGRLLRGEIVPGEETIGAFLGEHEGDDEFRFDVLFEVVSDAVE